MQQVFPNLYFPINQLRKDLKEHGWIVQTEKWQGIEKPPAMLEILNVGFQALVPENLDNLINQVSPSLPWADTAFNERVSGIPSNPGEAYKSWPYYRDIHFNDDNFKKDTLFSHTYQERYWPKEAGNQERYLKAVHGEPIEKSFAGMEIGKINKGIRYEYGDLSDVVMLLKKEPNTRQAYLPIWFPEDTGVLHGGRVPCSIGYHFILRDNVLNIHYTLRSCDAVRHFRNDIYLTVKLLYWVLDKLRRMDLVHGDWHKVKPGVLTMNIISFHCFEQEKNLA